MILVTGVDMIEIERIDDAIARHGEHFLNRIFTEGEREACLGRVESLAARFAAKEAAAKALGEGIGEIGWREIEVVGDENNAPRLHLHGMAAQKAREKNLGAWSVSLTHTDHHALAFVVAFEG